MVIVPLIVGLLEILQLDPSYINQGIQNVVSLAQPHVQRVRQLSLSQSRFLLKDLESTIFEFLVYHNQWEILI